jgi:hypothetical protein
MKRSEPFGTPFSTLAVPEKPPGFREDFYFYELR